MKKILRNIDIYGYQVNFTVGDNGLYTSVLGGITTILMMVFGIIFFIFTFIPFYERKNFTINSNTKISKSEIIYTNETDFNAVISLTKDSNLNGENVADLLDKYFDCKLTISSGFSSYEYKMLDIGEKFSTSLIVRLNLVDFKEFYGNLIPELNYISIDIYNKTSYGNPDFQSFLKNELNYIRLEVKINIKNIDYDDYENPLKHDDYFNFQKVDLTQKNKISTATILNKNIFSTDSHILWNSPQDTNYITVGVSEIYDLPDYDPSLYFSYGINCRNIIYSRRIYEKLPEIIAQVTSLISLINSILGAFFAKIYDFKVKVDTIRATTKNYHNFNHFRFTDSVNKLNSNNPQNTDSKNSNQIEENFKNGILLDKAQGLSIPTQGNLVATKKPRKNHIFQLRSSIWFLFTSSLCLNKKKRQSLNEIYEKNYDNFFDVYYYIKKLKEVGTMKKIIISNNSSEVFDFCSKNVVNNIDEEKTIESYKTQESIETVLDKYNILRRALEITPEETKLIEVFRDEIKSVIKLQHD